VALTWTSEWPFSYELQHRSNVASGAWTSFCTNAATGDLMTATDTNVGAQELRYYRVVCGTDGPASEVVFWPSIAVAPSLRMACSQAENLTLTLTWPTEPTYPYVLQYRTDVLSGAWTSLCTNVATSGSMSVTNTIPCGTPQRLYRAICLGVGP
jgi:hypothetical protein